MNDIYKPPSYQGSEIETWINELENQVSDREILGQSIEERLGFHRMLSKLSATFVNLPADEVDQMIEKALRELVEFLGIERCHLWQFYEDEKVLHLTHSWTKESIESVPKQFRIEKLPWLAKKLYQNTIVAFSSLDNLPEEASIDKQIFARFGTKSNISIPLFVAGRIVGALTFGASTCRNWSGDIVEQLKLISEVFSNALVRKKADEEMQKAFAEIKQLRCRLLKENQYLREKIKGKYQNEKLIGQSNAFKRVLDQIKQVAKTNSTVLIIGETGTGKELVAREIHKSSLRSRQTLVTVNCTALPSALIENELFGHEKGAYTGALTKQIGRFEIADGSTIFLDEVSELPLDLQAKLLRVIQEGEIDRLGSSKPTNVDIRVIASTNRDLTKAVREGRFRQDLYYRLDVFPILVPPLRERWEDIPLLVWTFVKEFGEMMGKTIGCISQENMNVLQRYPWPGNVRELRNIIERELILNKGPTLHINVPPLEDSISSSSMTLEEIEKKHILDILDKTGGRIRGKNGAAEILGLKPTTLDSRIKKLGIQGRKNLSD